MTAYYNEHDPFAAAWLRELVSGGHIAPGIVDERDIRDICPDELAPYAQCHFFAGIGGWAYALDLAGWPRDRSVWTGSCPCQPFSAAGRRGGTADERHLWPAFFHLINQCRPATVFGEQVASKDGLAWLDLVHADLEGAGYAVGAADLCAAGVGAPHIRQRLWFVADHKGEGWRDGNASSVHGHERARNGFGDRRGLGDAASERQREARATSDDPWSADVFAGSGHWSDVGPVGHERACGLANRVCDGLEGAEPARATDRGRRPTDADGAPCAVGDADRRQCDGIASRQGGQPIGSARGRQQSDRQFEHASVRHPWSDLEWLACRDGKARPTQSGIFPLAHGIPQRVGTLRGAGNAIVAPLAAEFVKAYMSA